MVHHAFSDGKALAFFRSGWVMSDWGGIHNTTPGAAQMAGVDQEQPGQDFLGPEAIADGIGNKTLTQVGEYLRYTFHVQRNWTSFV